ncbi:(2Fe-2S)-binding protein [Oceanisphaera sp. KMM 10153]|uniref:(2Fe-2S)-binding protein n=1 Tax=Oceanisphaera submarina TaxID=3390193 RepID=UPI003976815C
MFKDVSGQQRPSQTLYVDDQPRQIPTGYTVAAALLTLGYKANRASPVSGRPRGPYCMMGICFECLVDIDGIPNRQGCLTEVQPEMRVRLSLSKEQYPGEELDDGC